MHLLGLILMLVGVLGAMAELAGMSSGLSAVDAITMPMWGVCLVAGGALALIFRRPRD